MEHIIETFAVILR